MMMKMMKINLLSIISHKSLFDSISMHFLFSIHVYVYFRLTKGSKTASIIRKTFKILKSNSIGIELRLFFFQY